MSHISCTSVWPDVIVEFLLALIIPPVHTGNKALYQCLSSLHVAGTQSSPLICQQKSTCCSDYRMYVHIFGCSPPQTQSV